MPDEKYPKVPPIPRPAARPNDRDQLRRKTPPRGVGLTEPPKRDRPFSFEETTQVGTDAQVFRAVKALHERLDQSEDRAATAHGALNTKVDTIKVELGDKIDAQSALSQRTAGQVDIIAKMLSSPPSRLRSPSSEMRATSAAVNETLAQRILSEQDAAKKFRRKVLLMIVGGVIAVASSTVFLQWALSGKTSTPVHIDAGKAP